MRSVSDRPKKVGKSAHLALYRKYRPETLDQIVGQPQVTDIIKKSAAGNNFAHAYLFTGQRGTGKTSAARIVAHLINQTDYSSNDIDIIEIDAASHGGVEEARELREKAFLAPIAASHKVYIIDEVHMLSTQAFNALLKIIEEPPEHIVFIMATTELQKVPATILSRVQRFHFKPVPLDVVADHLAYIAGEEDIKADRSALELIARHGGGSFRDSITLLDQLGGSGAITGENVEAALGLAPQMRVQALIQSIIEHDVAGVIKSVDDLQASGINTSSIVGQLIDELLEIAPENPKLYSLIESLLEVNGSAAPAIKLLAVLSLAAAKSATRNAVVATATTYEQDKLATIIEKKVKSEPTLIKPETTVVVEQSKPEKSPAAAKLADKKADAATETVTGQPPAEIVWQDILDELKNLDRPAALATLKFATTDYDHDTLTLYFERAFHRKKADAPSCRESLQLAFAKLYNGTPRIVVATTAQSAADSKDSLVAGVAAIMGGGDIVRET